MAKAGVALERRVPARRGVRTLLRRIRRDKRAMIGGGILLVVLVVAVLAPWIAPYDPLSQEFDLLKSPTLEHPLGTDDLGRDLLSRVFYGSRVSLLVGITSVALAAIAGILMGLLAGYYRGWVDMLVMRYIDIQWAFPNFIIAVALVAIFGTGLENVIVAIGLAYVDDFARVVRGMVLAIREEDYVGAARAVGAPDRRILFQHILPNAMAPVIVQASVLVSGAILAEAALSFLGLGVNPTTPTWGLILNDARPFISIAWWLGIFPGLAIMLLVLAINFTGDAIRDIMDVREYGREPAGGS